MRTVLRLILRVLFACALLGVPLVLTPPASAMSCAGPEAVLGPSAEFPADQVFRGRIVDAVSGELVVEVSEVWKGRPVDSRVRLQVYAPGWSMWAGKDGEIANGYSDDRDWLFAPSIIDGIPQVGLCDAWPTAGRGGMDVMRFRPAQVSEPRTVEVAAPARQNAERDGNSIVPVAVGVGAAALLVPAVAVVVVRRRTRLT